MTSWRRSSTANETKIFPFHIMAFKALPNVIIIFPFPGIMALPTQVLWGVVVMPFLLLISCGFFLWQPTVIRSFSKMLFLVSVQTESRVDDYWAEDFDSGKNCEQEEKMIKLLSEVGWCTFTLVSRNYLNILQANNKNQADRAAPTQCSRESVL